MALGPSLGYSQDVGWSCSHLKACWRMSEFFIRKMILNVAITVSLIIADMLTFISLLGVIVKFLDWYSLANVLPLAMVVGCLNLYKNNVKGKTNRSWGLMKVNRFYILSYLFHPHWISGIDCTVKASNLQTHKVKNRYFTG